MKISSSQAVVLACVLAGMALPAFAADRVRAGQWVGTTTTKDKTYNSSNCMTQADADAMNGDAKSVQAYMEKTIPPEICKLSNFKVNGAEIVYTSVCGGTPANVVTTVYHGNSFESTTSTGTKSSAKLTGACK